MGLHSLLIEKHLLGCLGTDSSLERNGIIFCVKCHSSDLMHQGLSHRVLQIDFGGFICSHCTTSALLGETEWPVERSRLVSDTALQARIYAYCPLSSSLRLPGNSPQCCPQPFPPSLFFLSLTLAVLSSFLLLFLHRCLLHPPPRSPLFLLLSLALRLLSQTSRLGPSSARSCQGEPREQVGLEGDMWKTQAKW